MDLSSRHRCIELGGPCSAGLTLVFAVLGRLRPQPWLDYGLESSRTRDLDVPGFSQVLGLRSCDEVAVVEELAEDRVSVASNDGLEQLEEFLDFGDFGSLQMVDLSAAVNHLLNFIGDSFAEVQMQVLGFLEKQAQAFAVSVEFWKYALDESIVLRSRYRRACRMSRFQSGMRFSCRE